jgi:predicted nuclease of restriction endonuclease-like (RecB) superfamily
MTNKVELSDFNDVVIIIKDAIIRSRYQAATLVNKELLGLYYAVGCYVSKNSRESVWGQGAIKQISETLQYELPGLRGFSEASIKRMRLFYENWQPVFINRPLAMDDLRLVQVPEEKHEKNDLVLTNTTTHKTLVDLDLLSKHINGFVKPGFITHDFFKVGFTHHSEILAKEKSLSGRLFYISKCAVEFWSVEALKSSLRSDLFTKAGSLPNNFIRTLPESEQARCAVRAFKDEYLLDFINIEDENDPDERLIERGIIASIKQFILSLGNKFCFIGNQYRMIVEGKEFFIDLLFFNRELHCLVAIELKRGEFKPAHLGQLNFYLSILDDYVRQPDESPSLSRACL